VTEKKPTTLTVKHRAPRTITILEAIETMQDTDNLSDDDTIGVLKTQLKEKVVQEARRR